MTLLRKAAERYAEDTSTPLTVVEGAPSRLPLTDRQREIYGFIVKRFRATQQAPSMREVMARFDIGSTNAVTCHLESIARKGWIEMGAKGHSRAIRIVPQQAGQCVMCGCGCQKGRVA